MHQCRSLAEQTAPLDYAGVVGPDQTTSWFARRAAELGVKFLTPIPQRIHRLTGKPKYPGCPGYPRRVTADDANLLADWIAGFMREATPRDPVRDDCVPATGAARAEDASEGPIVPAIDKVPAVASTSRRLTRCLAFDIVNLMLEDGGIDC